jgi:hypothetical protein
MYTSSNLFKRNKKHSKENREENIKEKREHSNPFKPNVSYITQKENTIIHSHEDVSKINTPVYNKVKKYENNKTDRKVERKINKSVFKIQSTDNEHTNEPSTHKKITTPQKKINVCDESEFPSLALSINNKRETAELIKYKNYSILLNKENTQDKQTLQQIQNETKIDNMPNSLEDNSDIPRGWIKINKKTCKIIKNKLDVEYDTYIQRNTDMTIEKLDIESDTDDNVTSIKTIIPVQSERSIEHNLLKEMFRQAKYKKTCNKLNNLYEIYKEEDEMRGYSQEEDVVQGWEIDEYTERMEWEKRWEYMELGEMETTSGDEVDNEEASDIEYLT